MEDDWQLIYKNLQWEKKEKDVVETVFCQEDASSQLALSEVSYFTNAGIGGLPCLMEGPSGECFDAYRTAGGSGREFGPKPGTRVPAEVPCVLL